MLADDGETLAAICNSPVGRAVPSIKLTTIVARAGSASCALSLAN
jgi:hypothetical protein